MSENYSIFASEKGKIEIENYKTVKNFLWTVN